MLYVTRRAIFSASHRLNNENLSEEENKEIFDKCNNYHGHGHNYTLEVVVAGEVNPVTGYVIDLKVLKSIIEENVISKLDHKHLNHDVDFMKGINPTAENITVAIWDRLNGKINEGKLYSVKLYETENNYVEYRGEANEF
ncbi:MAG: 6-carboxytetrahydropterin synthase [Bacteroidetes bacterium]|nr:6-carboxytetrahydropterin synthase [Bacteroidota bacterium]MBU1678933.1 6-carboxytetrahydropterin synthase [Bacteroidota bacterium]MBU2506141.1 6-carboxytetrahydropterin synthase [Bacteroidota bacterium]